MLAVLRTLNFLPPTRSYQALMLQNAQLRQQPRLVSMLAIGLPR